jgi:hypothetical protein
MIQWTLLMDAFILSTFSSKPRSYGIWWDSPTLNLPIPTEMFVTLSWFWMIQSPEFANLRARGLEKNRTTFSALISINNGERWISLSNSFYFDPDKATFSD